LRYRGKFPEAEKICRQLLDQTRQRYGSNDRRTADVLDRLGLNLQAEGQAVAAVKNFKDAYDICCASHADAVQVSRSLLNLAGAEQTCGRCSEAETHLRELVHKDERLFGENDGKTVNAMFRLAEAVAKRGDIHEAGAIYEKALTRSKAGTGDDSEMSSQIKARLVAIQRRPATTQSSSSD